jgi:hypothetical protein
MRAEPAGGGTAPNGLHEPGLALHVEDLTVSYHG